jgi:hypothetical protein
MELCGIEDNRSRKSLDFAALHRGYLLNIRNLRIVKEVEFRIMFRRPEYPVLIVSADKLYSAFNLKQLAEICVSLAQFGTENKLQVVDSNGSEFWYLAEEYILSPGFVTKKWTKKKLIETFNNSSNARPIGWAEARSPSIANDGLPSSAHPIETALDYSPASKSNLPA